MDLASGTVKVRIEVKEQYYYEMLSVLAGVEIKGEYDLVQTIRELSAQREEYRKVEDAIHAVRGCGYGVVIPGREEIQLEEPAVIHQGNKYGVKIKSVSPSIHMIKANIETEIAPIVGSEQQAEDLIAYIKESAKSPEESGIPTFSANPSSSSLTTASAAKSPRSPRMARQNSRIHAENCQRQPGRNGVYYHLIQKLFEYF